MTQPSHPVRPNFIIAGASRSGTTSIYYYLRQHPEIFMPETKEPYYFVNEKIGVNDLNAYLSLFQFGRGKKAIGEASTAYLTSHESAGWIKKELGVPRIIIMLRNPANRAFSLYGWMVMKGYERLTTFEEALMEEDSRYSSHQFRESVDYFWDYMYFQSGLYYEQVKRYQEHFGPELVRIHLFEDMVKDPLRVCRDIFAFLGVSRDFIPRIELHNKGRIPRSITLQYWVRKNMRRNLPRPFMLVSERLRRVVFRRLEKLNKQFGKAPENPVESYGRLMALYRDNILQLEELLGRDLSVWHDSSI